MSGCKSEVHENSARTSHAKNGNSHLRILVVTDRDGAFVLNASWRNLRGGRASRGAPKSA
jgi:hypothetical protein